MMRLVPEDTPLVILAEGCFGQLQAKTATGVIRYGRWPISAVLDSTQAGQTIQAILKGNCQGAYCGHAGRGAPANTAT